LRVQAQAGFMGRFRRRAGNFGPRLKRLGWAEAQVAGMGSAPTRTELAALFDGFVK